MASHTNVMHLKIFTTDNQLKSKYRLVQESQRPFTDTFPDAGFDLYCPEEMVVSNSTQKVDLKIKCAAFDYQSGLPISYYLYPRSSISKTPLRLANSVGIIDSGYRGNIMAAVDKPGSDDFTIQKHARYFQICSPTLCPIRIEIVHNESDLGSTSRGQGGFGSTGV